ncbi:MAG: hypothetical protein KGJ45_11770, partial [Elusimicrobia bacterium]|nr:hypothetical protein [Elusimicrobiota bacterium]
AGVQANVRDMDPLRYDTYSRAGLDYGPVPVGPVKTGDNPTVAAPQTGHSGQVRRVQALTQAVGQQIPRIWTDKLTGRDGPRQWGFQQAFHQMWLPPVYPSSGRRATAAATSLTTNAGGKGAGYGDFYRVPAVYVGQVSKHG